MNLKSFAVSLNKQRKKLFNSIKNINGFKAFLLKKCNIENKLNFLRFPYMSLRLDRLIKLSLRIFGDIRLHKCSDIFKKKKLYEKNAKISRHLLDLMNI